MGDKMALLLDATQRDLIALLTAHSQRPSLDLTRALRAKLAQSLNQARLIGSLHANSPRLHAAPALSESEALGATIEDDDTLPSHRPR